MAMDTQCMTEASLVSSYSQFLLGNPWLTAILVYQLFSLQDLVHLLIYRIWYSG